MNYQTSSDYQFLIRMADGTLKQINPFSGTQVWTVPGRGNRPISSDRTANLLAHETPESYCAFCESRYFETPPEKERLVLENGEYNKISNISGSELLKTKAEFRRVSNLFEIISFDYWQQNYGFNVSDSAERARKNYMSTPEGKKHVMDIIDFKLRSSGLTEQQIDAIDDDDKMQISNGFFAGCHELIIGRKHFFEGATHDNDNCSSGCLTPEEHYQYINFTVDALKDIYLKNRYARFVTVFQNWLKPAGASFDHLHKQLVAIDGRSAANDYEFQLARSNPNLYNDYAANYAGYNNLVVAENDYAIAFADFGHRYPTLAVYSKAKRNQPWNQNPEEIRGMSDLVHACHAAMGNQIPCNEEWYYRPPDVDIAMPWHILIKWRISNPAGFEAVTKIFVNTIEPWTLRDKVVPKLFSLRKAGKIARMKIAMECDCVPNCLMYNPYLNINNTYSHPGREKNMNL
ncbi:MAG: DUF4921 family protein [Alphaproteobacteria bacterium]